MPPLPRRRLLLSTLLLASSLAAGAQAAGSPQRLAFSQPTASLSAERRLEFAVGNSFFRNPWVPAPSSTDARDGLGPLFNTNACINCHVRDGRGQPPQPDSPTAVSMLVRLSIPATADQQDILQRQGVIAEPTYGGQLQDGAIAGLEPEGRIRLEYQPVAFRFSDGHVVQLQRPQLQIDQLAYGPLHPDTRFSVRVAPPMIGLGLLEAISESDLQAQEDPDDRNGDGISGRLNQVWDVAGQHSRPGRFGWKAGQPTLNQQNAAALRNDMGLSTSLLPGDNCTERQPQCASLANGGSPEVADPILARILFYTRNLAVPPQRHPQDPQVQAGAALFQQAGCAGCHREQYRTRADAAEPELANQLIRPYSDLLLHDMGEDLADNREEFLASGREWRTPPLWGIGLTAAVSGHTRFLHDGRARDLLEAVLWHGGEATAAREQVRQFDAGQRAALLAFLNSL